MDTKKKTLHFGVSTNKGVPQKNVFCENNGSKPYEQMDDLGGKIFPLFLVQHPFASCKYRATWMFSGTPEVRLDQRSGECWDQWGYSYNPKKHIPFICGL